MSLSYAMIMMIFFWNSIMTNLLNRPVNSIICSSCILETGKCWQAHCSPIGWHFLYTNYQPIGEYRRVGLAWPWTGNYTIASPFYWKMNKMIIDHISSRDERLVWLIVIRYKPAALKQSWRIWDLIYFHGRWTKAEFHHNR